MNLYFRFLYQLITSYFSSKMKLSETDQVSMCPWPLDLDANFHLNNGVFLSMMDIGRTRFSIRSGLFKKCRENGWGFGMVGGSTITYFKSIAPFQRFVLKTKLAGHYDGWVYLEQRFEIKGKLAAAALVKVIFMNKGKRVTPEDILESMSVSEIGENQVYLEHLYTSEKEFLTHIKRDYTAN